MFDIEDVSPESSPEVSNNTQPAQSEPSEAPQSAAPEQKQDESQPFHTHPRFQELISEKNQLKEQTKAFERQIQELTKLVQQSQAQKQPERDELMERLKGIDPAFADRFGKISEVDALKQELAEIKQWREQANAQTVQQNIQSSKDKFYTENNVPSEHRKLYEAQLMLAAQADPSLRASDLPKVMKSIHDEMSKLFQTTQREATKQLVESKKVDAARPALQPKGAPASAKQEAPMSKADSKKQLVSDVLANIRAGKDI